MGGGITLTRKDGIPDYAQRFADSGFAVLAFDYRHWGDSGGEPRRSVSVRSQLEDWRVAVQYARALEGIGRCQLLNGEHASGTASLRSSLEIYERINSPNTQRVATLLRNHHP